jgi:Resolvase, N terminal domain
VLKAVKLDSAFFSTRSCLLREVFVRQFMQVGALYESIQRPANRPGLDRLLGDGRRGKFDVLAIWAFDRLARSVSHLIRLLDDRTELGVEFISFREAIDMQGPLGKAITIILGGIAELERSMLREHVCAGAPRPPSRLSESLRYSSCLLSAWDETRNNCGHNPPSSQSSARAKSPIRGFHALRYTFDWDWRKLRDRSQYAL